MKVERVEAIMSFPQVFPKDDIRFRYNLGGGVTMDSGCYTVNAIRYFTNLPVYDVQSAHPRIVAEDPDVDGRMEMVLKLGKVGEGGGEGMRERGIVEAKAVASLTNPMWSLQTWREYLPRVVVETEGKVLTFMVFLIPSVSVFLHFFFFCFCLWAESMIKSTGYDRKTEGRGRAWTRRVFFFFVASP